MTLIAKVSTYVDGNVVTAAGQNNNESRLYDFLSGIITTHSGKIAFSGTDPVLELDQQSTGHILKLTKSGADKFLFTDDGVLQTFIATGTKPFNVASTTLCDNLNADLLDGLHAVDLGLYNNIKLITANYTILDPETLIFCNVGAGDYTVTLPSGTLGYNITIIKNFNADTVTITAGGSGTIKEAGKTDGTKSLSVNKSTLHLVSDGAGNDDWWVINRYIG